MASIELALDYLNSLEEGEKANISFVAKKFGVNRSTLSKRFRGVTGSKDVQYQEQQLLNKQQSDKLIEYVNKLTERGLPPTHSMLRTFAGEIAGVEPGKNWVSRWLKAHSEKLISHYSTGLDINRKRADSAYKYSLYFELLRRKFEQYRLAPEQIYNMDEKGFLLGILTKQKRIFGRKQYEKGGLKQFIQDGNREWITTLACICANGTWLPPALIYQAKSGNLQDSWLQDLKDQRCYFAASESGWTNNDIGYKWLKDVFDKETRAQASRGWRLLILDGHGSHVTMRFIDYCDANRILLAIFPAHATHTLQPLDVALFGPLATAYTKQLHIFLDQSQGLSRLTKRDFFRLFWASWEQVFTSKNILSGFKSTGLSPFDPEVILQRFNKKSESRPSSSSSTASIIKAEDWRRIQRLVSETVSDVYDKKAQKLSNTMLAITAENSLLKSRCENLEKALINEKKHRSKKKALLFDLPTEQDGGAIFFSPTKVQQARDLLLQKSQQAEQEQARKSDQKLQQQLKKETKEQEKQQRAQIRQEKQQQRQQEAAEKEQLKYEQQLAKLADLQLQEDVLATPRPRTNRAKPNLKPKKLESSSIAASEDVGEVLTTNRHGRPIRLPQRYR